MNAVERNISLVGKSGHEYYGKLYENKECATQLSGEAIVCLTNSTWEDNHWQHRVLDIYNDDALHAIDHFKERDDISHLILIPVDPAVYKNIDVIDDIRRQYIHK